MRQSNLREYLGPLGYMRYLKSRAAISQALDDLVANAGNTISCPVILEAVKLYKSNDPIIMHHYRTMIYQSITVLHKKNLTRKVRHGVFVSEEQPHSSKSGIEEKYEAYFPTFKKNFWKRIMKLKPGQKTCANNIFSAMKLPNRHFRSIKNKYYSYICSMLRLLAKAGAFIVEPSRPALKRAPDYIRTSLTLIPPSKLKYKPFGRL